MPGGNRPGSNATSQPAKTVSSSQDNNADEIGGNTGNAGRGGQANTGGHGRNRNRNRNHNNQLYQSTGFEGRNEKLRGFTYDLTNERKPDQYIQTTKELIHLIGEMYTKYTQDFTEAVEKLGPAMPMPPDRPDTTDPFAMEIWKLDVKEHQIKEKAYRNFLSGLFNLVLGQCTEALCNRIESHVDYQTANTNKDGISLLKIIKKITFQFEERRKLVDALVEAKTDFYLF